MYRVLYRKYRPRFFADVIGQPQVTETLKNELRSGRTAHAYLFTGSRGTGKTTCSKILAKAVNCLHPQDGDPCGECECCRGVDEGTLMDVVEIDAASNNGVGDIRSLREEAVFTPAVARYRVYIIDEVHMLTLEAFNALLKTLEEPPEHVIFILATTEIHKLPATIRSRCQRFDFRRIPSEAIAGRLRDIARKEGVELDPEAALLIAGIADGAMRDALSLLDQCMSSGERITETVVRETAGLADKSHLFALTEAVKNGDCAGFIETVDALYAASKDMARLCVELTEHFRELMLIKTVRQPRDLIVMSEEDFAKAKAQAEELPLEKIVQVIDLLTGASEKMPRSTNRRVLMEMTGVKVTSSFSAAPPADSSLEARLEKLEKAMQELASGVSPAPQPSAQAKAPSAYTLPRTAPPKRPSSLDMERLRSQAVPFPRWGEVIDQIKQYSRSIAASFEGSTAYISGPYVLVDSKNDFCFELLRNSVQKENMRQAIKQVTGTEYKLGRYSYPEETAAGNDALRSLQEELTSAGVTMTGDASQEAP